QGTPLQIILAIVTATIGVIGLGAAGARYLFTNTTRLEQVLLFIGALCLIKPGLVTDIAGLSFLIPVIIMQKRRVGKLTASPSSEM
ncbi:MAG: C4-dicarboxylate ABC transporter permease, partial [Bacillota bacterium]